MEATEQGRFCNTCQKPVVDFTNLTDHQVLHYFLAHPFPVCGRMLNGQSDHTFIDPKSKINRKLFPVAAALLTLSTIKIFSDKNGDFRITLIKNFLENEAGISTERIQVAGPELRKQKKAEVTIEFN